jgi:hypothetical protein
LCVVRGPWPVVRGPPWRLPHHGGWGRVSAQVSHFTHFWTEPRMARSTRSTVDTTLADPVRAYVEGVAKSLVDRLYGSEGPAWGTKMTAIEGHDQGRPPSDGGEDARRGVAAAGQHGRGETARVSALPVVRPRGARRPGGGRLPHPRRPVVCGRRSVRWWRCWLGS